MNKKASKIGIVFGILMGATIVAYAITSLFFTTSERSNLSKKTVFQFDLTTDMSTTVVGPGDSFDVKPVIYNDATEEMYAFIKIEMPTTVNGALYSFDVDNDWMLVESGNDTFGYQSRRKLRL